MKRILAILAGSVLFATFGSLCSIRAAATQGSQTSTSNNSGEGTEPVVDLSASSNETETPTRHARSARHNNRHGHELTELPPGIEPYPEITHWNSGLPALPVQQSDTIVVATVESSQAFLSADRHSVYSDFGLVVARVLKTTGIAVTQGQTITAERTGGAVKFPSGRITRFRIHQQGFPEPARQYLFFLKSQPESADFYIVTGYELNSGKVQPLDGVGFNKTEYSQFAQYQGVEEVSFLSQVVQEINAEPGAARFAAVDFHGCDT